MRVELTGPALAVQTCARRLSGVGVGVGVGVGASPAPVTAAPGPAPDGSPLVLDLPRRPGDGPGGAALRGHVSWFGPAGFDEGAGSEAAVQARSGLMYLHGRDAGRPRRIGVEIASVAAGVLAAQSVLASAIGRWRGARVDEVRTSVLQAALLQASHYLAASTCEQEWVPGPPAPAPGPPFRTSDDRWFEIETFDAEAWKGFWLRLGAPPAALGRAWTLFRPRYYRGTASMPDGFHEATAAHDLAEVTAAAAAFGVSLCPVRRYEEVLVEPGRSAGHPRVEPLVGPDGDAGHTVTAGRVVPFGAGDVLPLAGIEVVEATSRLQGPLAGLLLQMLGARVTRVEPPGGDVGRGVPPLAGDTGSFFLTFNRAKHTVELDLAAPSGRAELADLAAGADVFLHNWRPGKAQEWGLGPDDLSERHRGLVYTAASGWEEGSSAARLIGTDFLVQAFTGLGDGLEPESEPPAPSRLLLTDFMGALVSCEGVLSGLYRRELQDGRGCRVHTSLQAGAMALQAHVLDGVDGTDGVAGHDGRRRRGRPVWGPLDVPLEASDGFLVIEATGEDGFARLGEACGVGASAGRAEAEHTVAERIRSASVQAWEKELGAAGIACAPVVCDLAALPHDACTASLFETLAGPCRAPASPWRFAP